MLKYQQGQQPPVCYQRLQFWGVTVFLFVFLDRSVYFKKFKNG
jgi:hypothetical protein